MGYRLRELFRRRDSRNLVNTKEGEHSFVHAYELVKYLKYHVQSSAFVFGFVFLISYGL